VIALVLRWVDTAPVVTSIDTPPSQRSLRNATQYLCWRVESLLGLPCECGRWEAFRAILGCARAHPLALEQAADRAVAAFMLIEACLARLRHV
jgi:hypothetical protein